MGRDGAAMLRFVTLAVLGAMTAVPAAAHAAEFKVVVHPSNPIVELQQQSLSEIFLARTR